MICFLRALRKPSTIVKSRQTNNVRHPRSPSCNYHCRVPHTEGHLEPERNRNKKRSSTKFNLLLSPGQTDSPVDASWKLGSTCDSVWSGLACTCVDLRWLTLTCAHFGRDQICTQVDANFLLLGHPTQVNLSWDTSIKLLLPNEVQDMSA